MSEQAFIEDTRLGYIDGHLTFSLLIKSDGWYQGFGSHRLSVDHIQAVLDGLGVQTWEELPGHFVEVDGTMAGIRRIRSVGSDRWVELDPAAA